MFRERKPLGGLIFGSTVGAGKINTRVLLRINSIIERNNKWMTTQDE